MRTSFIEDLQSDFAVAEQYVSTAGETAWEELSIGMTLPPNTTSIVAYMKYESGTDVFFDDLKIELNAVPVAMVVQENHYYPFGMGMKGLDYTAPSPNVENKFTFNGVERNTSLSMNIIETKFRMGDTQLGRWWQIDPKPTMHESTYTMMGNNPMRYADPRGDTVLIRNGWGKTFEYRDGKLFRNGAEYTGKVRGFVKKAVNALNQIGSCAAGGELVNKLVSSTSNYTIRRGDNRFEANSTTAAQRARTSPNALMPPQDNIGRGGTIYWRPSGTTGGPDQNGNTSRPAFIGLTHELGHAESASRGMQDNSFFAPNHPQVEFQRIKNDEYNAAHWENRVRSEHQLPLREFYTRDSNGAGFMRLINAGTTLSINPSTPINNNHDFSQDCIICQYYGNQ
jgi:RHS repeat-associated protein